MNSVASIDQSLTFFAAEDFQHPVTAETLSVFNKIWRRLAQTGDWWSGTQRVAIAKASRNSKPREVFNRQRMSVSELSNQGSEARLSPLVIDVVERVTTESGSLSREWCEQVCAVLGEGAYVELVAIVAITLPIDRFCRYLGASLKPLPAGDTTAPAKMVALDLVDIDAWVAITQEAYADKDLVNVSRALSQAREENLLRRELVDALYMQGHSFFEARWSRKSLSRPQLEIAATRTSLINECFYCAHGHSAILDIASKAIGGKASIEAALGESDADVGVEHGALILEYTELANRIPDKAYSLFARLSEVLGEKAAVELAATVAIFNGLNRTSDPTGMPMEDTLMAYGKVVGAKRFASLERLSGRNNVRGNSWLKSLSILLALKVRRFFSDVQ